MSRSAHTSAIFSDLKNFVLLSIVQFCDSGMSATFDTTTLYIYDTTTIHLQGKRNLSTGLWYIDLAHQVPVMLTPSLYATLFPVQLQAKNV